MVFCTNRYNCNTPLQEYKNAESAGFKLFQAYFVFNFKINLLENHVNEICTTRLLVSYGALHIVTTNDEQLFQSRNTKNLLVISICYRSIFFPNLITLYKLPVEITPKDHINWQLRIPIHSLSKMEI